MDNLLELAGRLAQTNPRRTPTTEEARTAALEAIREVAWIVPGPPTLTDGRFSTRLRWRLFRLATTVGMPIHRLGIRVGLHWIDGLRQRVANLLQPKAP
jgi:hypothetical protein